MSTCAVCGKKITYTFDICKECKSIYGEHAKDWPEWVRFLVNDNRKQRYWNKQYTEHELNFNEIDFT